MYEYTFDIYLANGRNRLIFIIIKTLSSIFCAPSHKTLIYKYSKEGRTTWLLIIAPIKTLLQGNTLSF